jgi:hypothetical protein
LSSFFSRSTITFTFSVILNSLSGNSLHAAAGVTSTSSDSLPTGKYAVVLSYKDAKNNPSSYVIHTYYGFTSSIDTIHKENPNGFKVFPIPATTTINISMIATVASTSKVVTIWDHSGQVVKRLKFNTVQGYNVFTIPVTGFSHGVYILQDGDKVTSFIKL